MMAENPTGKVYVLDGVSALGETKQDDGRGRVKDTAHLQRTVRKGHAEETSGDTELEGGQHADIWEKCSKQKRQARQRKAEGDQNVAGTERATMRGQMRSAGGSVDS